MVLIGDGNDGAETVYIIVMADKWNSNDAREKQLHINEAIRRYDWYKRSEIGNVSLVMEDPRKYTFIDSYFIR